MTEGKTKCGRIIGGFFAFISLLIALLFSMEIWMCIILTLSVFQQDGPVRSLSNCMLANMIVTQTIKRLVFRKRPCDYQPPRAFKMLNVKSSSTPSRVVIASTTLVYACLLIDSWIGSYKWLNDVSIWGAIGFALLTFAVTSFTRVHLG